ncbi:transketolase [Patescibacteria group bacterium]
MKESKIAFLEEKALWVRQQVLEMCLAAGAGHIAPAFSCADILTLLYYGDIVRVDPRNRTWEDRDRFILSKGQACAGLYPILADLGFFPVEDLVNYCQNGSYLGGHTESKVPGVETLTGSLGHGLSIGLGMALAAKMDKRDYYTFVLLGDGSLQEGSNWEAVMAAQKYELDNLIAIVDRNNLQALDFTTNSIDPGDLAKPFEAFGWDVYQADGHSFEEMDIVFDMATQNRDGRPTVIIAHTTKGKGVSFMENDPKWHFRIPKGDEITQARKELKI